MADKKPVLYYVLVHGYHSVLPGRLMAVTSESEKRDSHGKPHMIYGRDVDHGYSTRRCGADVSYRFKDKDELDQFVMDCTEAEAVINQANVKVLRAHEHYRRMMMRFDKQRSDVRNQVANAKYALLTKLKEQA